MATAPPPPDAVRSALRAGWVMSELRGRLNPVRPSLPAPSIDRSEHMLPLAGERTHQEREAELRSVLGDLSTQLGVAAEASPAGATVKPGRPFATQLEQPAKTLADLRGTANGLATTLLHGTGWVKVVLGALGVIGLSIGAVQAALKNAAQSLFGRMRMDLYADLVITAITGLPTEVTRTEDLGLAVRSAAQSRPVTSSLPRDRPSPSQLQTS